MIIIQGVVGAGKSTVAEMLAARLKVPVFPEPVETNPYLSKYYADPERYAFPMQVFLLHNRFIQGLKAKTLKQCVMDTSMYGNDIFVEIQHGMKYMSDEDYITYSTLSNTYKNIVGAPDMMVYLQCSPQVAINRIIRRNRPSELIAPIQYWYDLYDANERWFEEYSDSKKILINVDHLNIITDESDEDYLIDTIVEALEL